MMWRLTFFLKLHCCTKTERERDLYSPLSSFTVQKWARTVWILSDGVVAVSHTLEVCWIQSVYFNFGKPPSSSCVFRMLPLPDSLLENIEWASKMGKGSAWDLLLVSAHPCDRVKVFNEVGLKEQLQSQCLFSCWLSWAAIGKPSWRCLLCMHCISR